MKVGIANSRCLKSAFLPFEKVAENVFTLRWGKKDEVINVYAKNEETGEMEATGETQESDWCTYSVCRWYGTLTPSQFVDKVLGKSDREASMTELAAIFEGLGSDESVKFPVMKEYLLKKIANYDASDSVNQFSVGGVNVWLDKGTRVGLKLRFDAELAQGLESTVLWLEGVSFPLALTGENNAFQMLNAIELYASACYDNTQKHVAAVGALGTCAELVAYDYTANYPEKLAF